MAESDTAKAPPLYERGCDSQPVATPVIMFAMKVAGPGGAARDERRGSDRSR